MIAGKLAQLERPTNEPLESWFRKRDLPAIEVERTQTSFDDRPIQQGTVATRKETEREIVSVGVDRTGDPVAIDTENERTTEAITTNWVADVTGSGLILAESAEGDNPYAFPFDLFTDRCGSDAEPLTIDVEELHIAWNSDDALGDVWMVGQDPGDGASIKYHDRASVEDRPTIGLGFVRPWSGTVIRGVVYESGYVALYSANHASEAVRFLEEEFLSFASTRDDDSTQSTFADDVKDHLEAEGAEVSE